MTPAAARNLERLLELGPTAGDDGPSWSYGGPKFNLHRRTYARRLVLTVLRRYGMVGGWYSTLTDSQLRQLEDLRGIGNTTVQAALREEEEAGRIVRLGRAELAEWLESIDRADLAVDLPTAKRFVVDLKPFAELLGDVQKTQPTVSLLSRRRQLDVAELVHSPVAEATGQAAHPIAEATGQAVPLACAGASNLVLSEVKVEVEVLPLTPSEIESGDPEIRRLWDLWQTGSALWKGFAKAELAKRGVHLAVDDEPEPEPEPEPKSPVSLPIAPQPCEPERPTRSRSGRQYPPGFTREAERLVRLLADSETRAAVAGRLFGHLGGPFGVTANPESESPAIWPKRFELLGESEGGRVDLRQLVHDTVRRAQNPERFFSGGLGILAASYSAARKKPAPTPTRQSAVGAGRSACVSVMANRTQGATP